MAFLDGKAAAVVSPFPARSSALFPLAEESDLVAEPPLAEPSPEPPPLTPSDLVADVLAEVLADVLAEVLADVLADPLLADDAAPNVPSFELPALPGYCANKIDGAMAMPPNPAKATIIPRTHITGRLLQQTITNLYYISHISCHNTAPGQSHWPAGGRNLYRYAHLPRLITADFHICLFVWLRSLVEKSGPKKTAPRGEPGGLFFNWQEWRGSNPQPPVLETGALPIELHSYGTLLRPFGLFHD